MICYRDMTFCNAYPERCLNNKCPRAFTEEERKRAKKWWGADDPPICFGDLFEPCLFGELDDVK